MIKETYCVGCDGKRTGGRPLFTQQFFLRIVLLIITMLVFTACDVKKDWVMFRGDAGRGYTPNAMTPPLGIRWKLSLQETGEPAFAFNNPVVLKDNIYFGSTDGNFYSLDLNSGYMRWVFRTNGAINSIPYADDTLVYIGSNDGRVYAVDREDGKEKWSFQADSTVQSTITRYRDTIVFVSDQGHAHFLTPEGEEKFRIDNPVWSYYTFQIYDDVMYFAPGPPDIPHSLSAFDIRSREYLWIQDTSTFDAVWYSFPAIKGKGLYFSTMDPYIDAWVFTYYCYDRKTGEVIWKTGDISDWGSYPPYSIEEYYRGSMKMLDYMAPALWRHLVIYTSGDSVVRAFDQETGDLAWKQSFPTQTSSAPTVAGNYVYFGLYGDTVCPGAGPAKLICLHAETGKRMWEMEIEGSLLSAPVIARDWMIFGTNENNFYVLEELF